MVLGLGLLCRGLGFRVRGVQVVTVDSLLLTYASSKARSAFEKACAITTKPKVNT